MDTTTDATTTDTTPCTTTICARIGRHTYGCMAAPLNYTDIEAGYENDGWLGFGYLGARRNAAEAVQSGEWESAPITAADEAALAAANAKRWTPARFFTWLNSKDGRWYADMVIGSDEDPATAAERMVR